MPNIKLNPLWFLIGWIFWGFWCGVGLFALVTISRFILTWAYRLAKYWPMSLDSHDPVQYRRPVLCRCEVNGRAGFVLQKDLRATSDRWWRGLYREEEGTFFDPGNIMWSRAYLCRVETVFVFPRGSDYSDKIARMYFTERAEFEVPTSNLEDDSELKERFDSAKRYFDSFGTVKFK